jgi:RNA recognition motif-containing protein
MAAQAAIQAAQGTAGASQAQQSAGGGKVGPVGANLFVYHIPNSWDDNILRQHFEHFGTILSCRIQKDSDGRARGFGFVSFDSPEAAQSSIAGMHGFPVEGKWLKVQLKKGDEEETRAAGGGAGAPPQPPSFQAVRPPPPPRPGPM